jgi:hypothetical protein
MERQLLARLHVPKLPDVVASRGSFLKFRGRCDSVVIASQRRSGFCAGLCAWHGYRYLYWVK